MILDLGSGVTTHVIRAVAAEAPGCSVVTTDTEPMWLNKTVLELERDGASAARCFRQEDFELWNKDRQYGRICVDCGNTAYRLAMTAKLAEWCAPTGTLFLDDFHLEPYATKMGAALEALGFTVTPQPSTKDEFGGFVALARRA